MSLSTLSNYGEVLDSLNGLYKTNMNRNAVAILIRSVIENGGYEIIEQQVATEEYQRPLGIERWKGYAMIPNQSQLNTIRNKIQEIIN